MENVEGVQAEERRRTHVQEIVDGSADVCKDGVVIR